MIVSEVYVIDVTTPEPGRALSALSAMHVDDRSANEQISNLMAIAPKGSAVRVVVGNMFTPAWPEFWEGLVRDYAVQIEGSPEAVRRWGLELRRYGKRAAA